MTQHQEIEHPAAWTRATLLARSDWDLALESAELTELESALQATAHLSLSQLRAEHCELPVLGPKLSRIQVSLEEGGGATLLRGLDLSRYDAEEQRRVFWILSQYIGTPVPQTAEGLQIFSVRDEGFGENDARTRGPNTRKKLSFHTDRCDVIAFCCLKPAKSGGENEIVSSMTVFNIVRRERPDLLEELLRPFLYQRHNVDTANASPFCEQPIFSFQDGHFASAFLRVLIERAYKNPVSPEMSNRQREALDFVERVAARPELHLRFTQEPGDLLFLNNWVTYHRRTEFVDATEPEQKRHLLRIWLAVPNSRPLVPAFEANYGAIAAGAIRGGFRTG